MNKKVLLILSSALTLAVSTLALYFKSNFELISNADNEIIEYYEGVAPTEIHEGKKEHWASCLSHKRWTDENREFEVSDEELILSRKTQGTLLNIEDVKQEEIKTINSFENVDQNSATYYSIDSRQAIYFSKSEKTDAYSKFTFNLSTPTTSAVGFDYKMYDLNSDRYLKDGLLFAKGKYSQKIEKANSYVEIKSGSDYRCVEKDLKSDNNWHTMLATFKDNIQIDEISIYIKNFVGEIYISDLTVNAAKATIRSSGTNASGIYLNTSFDNNIPAPSDYKWNYLSSQTNVGAVLKNGQGFIQTSNKIIFKLATQTYYLALADNDQTAANNDIVQLNGIFRYEDENRIYSYILLTSKMIFNGTTFTNYAQSIEGYTIGQNGNGGTTGFYLNNSSIEAVNLPTSGWSGSAFKPEQSDCLVIDGVNYGARNPSANTFLKLTDAGLFYMALDRQNAHTAINEGSVVEVNGVYLYDNEVDKINIEFNSVVLSYTNEKWSLYDFNYHFDGHGASKGESETSGTTGGLYFSLDKNAIPHSSSNAWNIYRLIPSSSNNIKLVRNGNQYNIAKTGEKAIDKYGGNGKYYYLEFPRTTYSTYGGPTSGDILIISGAFSNTFNGSSYTLNIQEFYAYYSGNKWIVNQSIEQVDNVLMGISQTHNADRGIYIRMDSNNIPYDKTKENWKDYKLSPLSTNCLTITRNETTTNIAMTESLQMIKFAQSGFQYYLELLPEQNPLGALMANDILTIQGYWKYTSDGVSHMINISPSSFDYDGTKWSIHYESVDVELGNATLGIGTNNETHIPLQFTANSLPLASYSLISGEVTINSEEINPTLVKNGDSNYILTLTTPASSGDILEINGAFIYMDPSSHFSYKAIINLSTFVYNGTIWQIAEFGGNY